MSGGCQVVTLAPTACGCGESARRTAARGDASADGAAGRGCLLSATAAGREGRERAHDCGARAAGADDLLGARVAANQLLETIAARLADILVKWHWGAYLLYGVRVVCASTTGSCSMVASPSTVIIFCIYSMRSGEHWLHGYAGTLLGSACNVGGVVCIEEVWMSHRSWIRHRPCCSTPCAIMRTMERIVW